MFLKIKELSSNQVIENFFHIGIIKFVNIFSKYFLIGYLIRHLGENSYGTLTWIESFAQYFLVLINFGFDAFIVKRIIENKENKNNLDKIISTVFILKTILFFLSFLILSIFFLFLDITSFKTLFYLMLCVGIGEVLFPLWYFQGVQKMKYLSFTSVVSKVFLIIATLLIVKIPEHIFHYISLLVISNLIYGCLGLYFLIKISKFKFIVVSFKVIKQYFIEGFLFYIGKTSTLFMNFGTIFLIGNLFSKNLVAGFDICSKVIFVFVFVYEVIQQSFFPSIVESQNKSKLGKLVLLTGVLGIIFGLSVYFFSNKFLFFLGGNEMMKYEYLLKQFAILIPVIGLSTILGSCGLIAFGGIRKFNYSFLIVAFIYILSVFILNYFDILTFQALVYVRIWVDIIMAILIIVFALQLDLLSYFKIKK